MDQEIEVKFLLSNPARYRETLLANAAKLIDERVFETNLRYDTPERSLTQNGQVLRLRRDSRSRLTYKADGRLEDGALVRTELETEVGGFDAMNNILEALGFVVFASYEKYRETFWLDGVTVSIDEMPYGVFTELEGSSPEQIHALADKLGLRWTAGIPSSYMLLFAQLKDKLELELDNLTFAAFEGLSITPVDLGVEAAD
jgi:adenylate cyclase class 2